MRIAVAVAVLCALLAGCGPNVMSHVTAFHVLDGAKTFRMAPLDGSLETQQYARLISQHLVENGWREDPNAPVAVTLAYAVGDRETYTISTPAYGQIGGGTSYISGQTFGGNNNQSYKATVYSPPIYGIVGTNTRNIDSYTRRLIVLMGDIKSRKTLYEATVISSGSASNFNEVAPCMINALFADFPGKSGETRTVVTPANGCIASR